MNNDHSKILGPNSWNLLMLPYKGKDSADVIKSRFLTWEDYPRLSTCVLNLIISIYCKREAEGDFTQERQRQRKGI